jgi:hypothetical protein
MSAIEDDDLSSADTDERFVAITATAFPPIVPPSFAPVNSVQFPHELPLPTELPRRNLRKHCLHSHQAIRHSTRADTPPPTGSTPA